jgi:hypothetical protein
LGETDFQRYLRVGADPYVVLSQSVLIMVSFINICLSLPAGSPWHRYQLLVLRVANSSSVIAFLGLINAVLGDAHTRTNIHVCAFAIFAPALAIIVVGMCSHGFAGFFVDFWVLLIVSLAGAGTVVCFLNSKRLLPTEAIHIVVGKVVSMLGLTVLLQSSINYGYFYVYRSFGYIETLSHEYNLRLRASSLFVSFSSTINFINTFY